MADRQVTLKVLGTEQEIETADKEFWRMLTPEQQIIETWRLSEELWGLRGELGDECRFCRSVTRLVRR